MAQYTDTDNGRLVEPGAYAEWKKDSSALGLSANGVLMLVGEADAGPDYSLEDDLDDNGFGPDQLSDVVAKYSSGRLVDAFRQAIAPISDPEIGNSFSKCVLIKTNVSAQASCVALNAAGGTYGTLYAKQGGKNGNMVYWKASAATAEVIPTTGQFCFLPPIGNLDMSFRANGGTVQNLTITALELPPAIKTALDALTGVGATGGTDRVLLTVADDVAIALISGGNVTISRVTAGGAATPWNAQPQVGDVVYIPSTSVIKGATSKNVGSFIVTLINGTNSFNATKLMDGSGVPGACTLPCETVAHQGVAAITEVQAYAPITMTLDAGVVVDGYAKSMEVNELAPNTDKLSNCLYDPLLLTKVAWVSKTGAPKLISSAAEYKVKFDVNRQFDNVQESFTCGGEVAFKVAYQGTTATLTIDTVNITVAGNGGDALVLKHSSFPTIADLCAFLNSHSSNKYSAAVGSATLGTLPTTALDEVTTVGIATSWGLLATPIYPGSIKIDAYRFYQNLLGSAVVQLGLVAAPAAAGLPAVQPVANYNYLANGTKGGTTNASYQLAVDAVESVEGNFLVPLFSADAATDIVTADTESTSTYTIALINAYAKTHCLKMSTLKERRRRQAFCSIRTTFTLALAAAAGMNYPRLSMSFMDEKCTATTGIVQFQPWMNAVTAAAGQACAGPKAIFNKALNISAALQAAKDFNPKKRTDKETALQAGLLPVKWVKGTGYVFVSDQTTYSTDNDPVFNSIQAIYCADVISATAEQAMEVYIGRSSADVDATVISIGMTAVMGDLLRLKWIAKSDDAPNGYKNLKVKMKAGVATVTCEVKIAGAIYYVPVIFTVSLPSSSAG